MSARKKYQHKFLRIEKDAQCRENSACSWIPEFDLVVFTSRYEEALRWMPFDALDVPTMTLERYKPSENLEGKNTNQSTRSLHGFQQRTISVHSSRHWLSQTSY